MDNKAAKLTTEVCVRRKVKGDWYVYTCEQLPGMYVAHMNDKVAYDDVPRSIALLLKLDFQMECTVTHKINYREFIRQSEQDGAREIMEERTRDLIDDDADQHIPFILQNMSHKGA